MVVWFGHRPPRFGDGDP